MGVVLWISSHTFFVLPAFIWELESVKRLIMKKLFATCLMLMNILPAFAYVRDDTDEGWGLEGTLLFFAIIIVWTIVSSLPKAQYEYCN